MIFLNKVGAIYRGVAGVRVWGSRGGAAKICNYFNMCECKYLHVSSSVTFDNASSESFDGRIDIALSLSISVQCGNRSLRSETLICQ